MKSELHHFYPHSAPIYIIGRNVYMAYGLPIRDILYHCDVLLQHCSTTATEVWMLGKPVFQVVMGTAQRPWPEEFMSGNHLFGDFSDGGGSYSALPCWGIDPRSAATRPGRIHDLGLLSDRWAGE